MSDNLNFDYFYGTEAEQFSYYRIPRVLVTGSEFKKLSTDAKLLYGLMLDRMGLSIKNSWLDEHGRVFIYYSLEDVQEVMNCAHQKGCKLLAELDTANGIGLIERIKQGQGKPTKIYVKSFYAGKRTPRPATGNPDFPKAEIQTSDFQQSRLLENGSADFPLSEANYTKSNYPYLSHPNPSIHPRAPTIDRLDCREEIKESIGYASLVERHQAVDIDGLFELITDMMSSTQETVRIGGEHIPIADVKRRFDSLNFSHIDYVLECMKRNTREIGNIRAYLLTALYNAPATIDQYYAAQIQRDFG